jgi:transcriptional regulator with XRE-family HTH domain
VSLTEKIYQLRKQHNMSQEQLAGKLGISRQAVSKWESGQSIPDTDKIIQLSKIFNVTADYLLKKVKPPYLSSRFLHILSYASRYRHTDSMPPLARIL